MLVPLPPQPPAPNAILQRHISPTLSQSAKHTASAGRLCTTTDPPRCGRDALPAAFRMLILASLVLKRLYHGRSRKNRDATPALQAEPTAEGIQGPLYAAKQYLSHVRGPMVLGWGLARACGGTFGMRWRLQGTGSAGWPLPGCVMDSECPKKWPWIAAVHMAGSLVLGQLWYWTLRTPLLHGSCGTSSWSSSLFYTHRHDNLSPWDPKCRPTCASTGAWQPCCS